LAEKGIDVLLDEGIATEPYFADLHRLLDYFTPFRPDTVLGIGGGSVLDIAKLLAALLDNDQTVHDVVGNGLLKKRTKKLICVPATSGTGSEVSPNAILIDDADGQKKGIISPLLVPDLVLVDPVLSISVPPSVTAATGLDALTHCIEAYTNKFSNPFIDVFALEGIRLIAANLVDAVQDGNNLVAREKLSMGSMQGGFCLGPVNTAAVHALAYPLGTMYHVAHGLSNAVLLPHVMEFNVPLAVEKYADVAGALGVAPDADLHAMAMKGILRIREIMQACKVPENLRSMGVTQASIPLMAQEAMKIQRLLKNNPRMVLLEDAINIYEKTF
jgi:alcohol dehydrogenase class IV